MNSHYNKIFFQGSHKSNIKEYFEGWYFKNVNSTSSYTISIIAGVSYNKVDPHCFIQFISCDEKNNHFTQYFRYPLSMFEFDSSPFQIKIGKCVFTESSISLSLENMKLKVKGTLTYSKLTYLKKTPFTPNIMGFFSYIPKLECNHHIISMEHKIHGSLFINDKNINFDNGIGYMEKDWGSSFPSEYIWIQCNNFVDPTIKLALSVAKIPFLGFSFRGFFCSLFIDQKEYRFATYNRSKVIIDKANEKYTSISFKKGFLSLDVLAEIDKVQSLSSPKNGIMNQSIKEGLSASISILFRDLKSDLEIVSSGQNAGAEIMMRV